MRCGDAGSFMACRWCFGAVVGGCEFCTCPGILRIGIDGWAHTKKNTGCGEWPAPGCPFCCTSDATKTPRADPPPPPPRCPPVSQGGGVGAVCIGMLHLVLNPDSTAPTAQTSRPVSNWMYERASAASYSWRAPPSGHIYAYIWPTGVGLVREEQERARDHEFWASKVGNLSAWAPQGMG